MRLTHKNIVGCSDSKTNLPSFKRNINLLIYHILTGFDQLSVYLYFVICNDFSVMLNHLTVVVFRVKREFRDELTCFFS